MKSAGSLKRNLIYFLYLLLVVFAAMEVVLRFYNPFPTRMRGDHIFLNRDQVLYINNAKHPKLDQKLTHTRNMIGFRGPDIPENFEKYLSIVTIGGSTTECSHIDDKKTWSYLVEQKLKPTFANIWINNAGLDGFNSDKHIILLNEHVVKLKPKMVLFLVGANDLWFNSDDYKRSHKNYQANYYTKFEYWVLENSEVVCLARKFFMKKFNGGVHPVEVNKSDTLTISDDEINRRIFTRERDTLVMNYKDRLHILIKTCRENNIEPVFLTQPTVAGGGIDSLTHVDLEKIKIVGFGNGKMYWRWLELYNDATKAVAAETNSSVIDMAHLLPKNSIYYYDHIHYTNKGCEKFASALYSELAIILKNKYGLSSSHK